MDDDKETEEDSALGEFCRELQIATRAGGVERDSSEARDQKRHR